MSESEMEDFLILRGLDEPITEEELDRAAAASGETLKNLRDEGTAIRWEGSEVLTNEEGEVTGTFCHYQAEDEAAIREHGERAGLPVTRVDRQGTPLEGEE